MKEVQLKQQSYVSKKNHLKTENENSSDNCHRLNKGQEIEDKG